MSFHVSAEARAIMCEVLLCAVVARSVTCVVRRSVTCVAWRVTDDA